MGDIFFKLLELIGLDDDVQILISGIIIFVAILYWIYKTAKNANTVCEGDGKHTQGLFIFIILSIITFGLYTLFWMYMTANRLRNNAHRYNITIKKGGGTILLWVILSPIVGLFAIGYIDELIFDGYMDEIFVDIIFLGFIIFGVYMALHTIKKSINALVEEYNKKQSPQINTNEDKMATNQDKVHLKTIELTFFQKLMQLYWLNPKRWLLDEFVLENGILTVKTKNGNIIQSPLSNIIAKYAVDQYDRYDFYLENENGKKLHFKEISYMLSDENWELIKSILPLKLGAIGKINNFLQNFN